MSETLDEIQAPVIQATLEYIRATSAADSMPFGRVVVPPRCGKTRIAADTMAAHGGTSVFLGPTQAIVEQAAAVFRQRMPHRPVYVVMQGSREVGDDGHVCATYQSLLAMHKGGHVPALMQRADVVFPDEAHKAMTELRQGLLREVFRREVPRIALTATPDYSEERALARFFPDLIHEMTIREGVQAGLMAPYRAEAFAVDVGATNVKVANGEFEQEKLGQAMSHLQMLRAATIVRYDEAHRHVPALMTCATRNQALTLVEHLHEHRPPGSPSPGLAISGHDREMVQQARESFAIGEIDTLVTVGMLIEGWNAPRCKLLVDLAPSISWVRSAQKYSRPMTRVGDTIASIVVLVPTDLPRTPILPRDVFGPSLNDLSEGVPAHHDKRSSSRATPRLTLLSDSGIGAQDLDVLLTRVAADKFIPRPREISIDPYDAKAVRRLMGASRPRAVNYVEYGRFINIQRTVDGISATGADILAALKLPRTFVGFSKFVARYYPSMYADMILCGSSGHNYWAQAFGAPSPATSTDDAVLLSSAEERKSAACIFRHEFPRFKTATPEDGVIAASGGTQPIDPETAIDLQINLAEVRVGLERLSATKRRILQWRFGLGDMDELTLQQVGEQYDLSRERIRGLQTAALYNLRRSMKGNLSWRGDTSDRPTSAEPDATTPRTRVRVISPSYWETVDPSLWKTGRRDEYGTPKPNPPQLDVGAMSALLPRLRLCSGSSCGPFWLFWQQTRAVSGVLVDMTPHFSDFIYGWIADGHVYCHVRYGRGTASQEVVYRRFLGNGASVVTLERALMQMNGPLSVEDLPLSLHKAH